MAQAQHENLFIYLILHMILGCRKDNRALATMADWSRAAARMCRLSEQRQRMESGALNERRSTVSRASGIYTGATLIAGLRLMRRWFVVQRQ